MPGVGERFIETVRQDVLALREQGPHLEHMIGLAAGLGHKATSAATDHLEMTLEDDSRTDLHAIVEEIDPALTEDLLVSFIGDLASAKLASLKAGTRFSYGKRARLHVMEAGVSVRSKRTLGSGAFPYLAVNEAVPGSVIHGRIKGMSSAPAQGGIIDLVRKWSDAQIIGVVNPSNGTPRAELEILARYTN